MLNVKVEVDILALYDKCANPRATITLRLWLLRFTKSSVKNAERFAARAFLGGLR